MLASRCIAFLISASAVERAFTTETNVGTFEMFGAFRNLDFLLICIMLLITTAL